MPGLTRYRRKRVSPKAHPRVRDLWQEMNAQRVNLRDIAARSGVHEATIGKWLRVPMAQLQNIEAVGNVLGLQLVWKRKGD